MFAEWILFLCGAFLVIFGVSFRGRYFLWGIFVVLIFLTGYGVTRHAVQEVYALPETSFTVQGVARIVREPEEKIWQQEVVVRMESCQKEPCPREKILWRAPLGMPGKRGERLSFACSLTVPKKINEQFDYRMFLAKEGVLYMCEKADFAHTIPDDGFTRVIAGVFAPKRALENALERSVPQPEAALAQGLLLGGDERLPSEWQQAFRATGLSHIIAISGYNIVLVSAAFIILGLGLGLWRRQAFLLAVMGTIFFVLLVGAPASAIRAGIMGCSVFAALSFGRLAYSPQTLLGTAFLMLFFNPLLLRYDIGFQLSFLATFALVCVAPLFILLFPKHFFGRGILEIAFFTFAIELFIIPLLIYHFHIVSLVGILTNMLVLPLIPYLMASAFVTALIFFFCPPLVLIGAGITYGLAHGIFVIVDRVHTWSQTTMNVSWSIEIIFLWYIVLFLGMVGIRRYIRTRYV